MYITGDGYSEYYSDEIDAATFNRLLTSAERYVDIATTGVDGVRKLRVAYPTVDEEYIKLCIYSIVHLLYQIDTRRTQTEGYDSTANGLKGKVISSMSAGNESVSYGVLDDEVQKAITDPASLDTTISIMIRHYLSGVADANGVSLLYMGKYPG